MRFLIVDDHELISGALTQILHLIDRGCEVHAELTIQAGVANVETSQYDFVFSDLRFGSAEPCFDLVDACVKRGIRCAVISGETNAALVNEAACRGAVAYFSKTLPAKVQATLISLVVKEGVTYSPMLVHVELADGHDTLDNMPAVKHSIMDMLAKDLSNKEIAKTLDLSPNTVKTYVSEWFSILGVANRKDAALAYEKLRRRKSGVGIGQ